MLNFTPHTVTVRDESGNDHVYPPSGVVARVEMTSIPALPLSDGTPTCHVSYGIALLPEVHIEDGGKYIVSTMFADAYREQWGRDSIELFVPDSGPSAIRENGQIVSVKSLIRR
jgi:hypothetical protein